MRHATLSSRGSVRLVDIGHDIGAISLGGFANDARLLIIANGSVAGKEHALHGMIDPGGVLDRLTGGRFAWDVPAQFLVGTGR